MAATGVFNSCVTALMKASCCSLRRISRTKKMVFTTTPPMIRAIRSMPRKSRMPLRQLSNTQPTYSRMTTDIRQAPSAMKKAIDFRRPAPTMNTAYDGKDGRCAGTPAGSLCRFAFDELAGGFRHLNGLGDTEVLQDRDQDPGGIELIPGQAVAC